MKTKGVIYCGLFTALIAVGAFIKIPIPVVPFIGNAIRVSKKSFDEWLESLEL